jgi:hypothetical protein
VAGAILLFALSRADVSASTLNRFVLIVLSTSCISADGRALFEVQRMWAVMGKIQTTIHLTRRVHGFVRECAMARGVSFSRVVEDCIEAEWRERGVVCDVKQMTLGDLLRDSLRDASTFDPDAESVPVASSLCGSGRVSKKRPNTGVSEARGGNLRGRVPPL